MMTRIHFLSYNTVLLTQSSKKKHPHKLIFFVAVVVVVLSPLGLYENKNTKKAI